MTTFPTIPLSFREIVEITTEPGVYAVQPTHPVHTERFNLTQVDLSGEGVFLCYSSRRILQYLPCGAIRIVAPPGGGYTVATRRRLAFIIHRRWPVHGITPVVSHNYNRIISPSGRILPETPTANSGV